MHPGPVARFAAPLARRLIFRGGGTRVAPHDTDLRLDRPDGVVLRGWTTHPGARRSVLYLGGNAEDVRGWRGALGHWLPEHAGYLLAYRGFGASTGTPSERHLVEDAVALHDLAAAAHPAGPVDVIGRSLGSGVAVQLAVRRPLARITLVTPFDSLAAVAADLVPWMPAAALIADRFDSAAVADRVRSPVLVLRAGRDSLVRPARTDRLVRSLPAPPRVVTFAAADHSSLAQDPAYWREIAAFHGGRG